MTSIFRISFLYLLKVVKAHPRFITLVALCAFAWVVLFSPLHLAIVRHHSVKYKFVIWTKISSDYSPEDGDYILLAWSGKSEESYSLSPGTLLVKRIGCSPGEKIQLERERIFNCDGRFLGVGMERFPTSDESLVMYPYEKPFHTVPAGFVFLIGDNSDSYDSRYFGFQPVRDIVGLVLMGI